MKVIMVEMVEMVVVDEVVEVDTMMEDEVDGMTSDEEMIVGIATM